METKEAIELTKSFRNDLNNKYFKNEIDYFDSVIELLKRGEKFEKMWEELRGKFKVLHRDLVNFLSINDFNKIEQKYFPKEK